MRLRPLSESECYVRCYGRDDESVRVLAPDPVRRARAVLSGEAVRRLFEDRLDVREPDAEPEAA